jgi:hypothetical protein
MPVNGVADGLLLAEDRPGHGSAGLGVQQLGVGPLEGRQRQVKAVRQQQLLRRAVATMLSLSFTRARVKEAARRPGQLPGYLRMFFGTGGHTERDFLVDYSPAGIRIVPDSGREIETHTWTRVANEILRMIARGEL